MLDTTGQQMWEVQTMTNQHEVRKLHDTKPWMTVPEVAKELKCGPEYVRSTCRRLGIRFAPVRGTAKATPLGSDIRAILEGCPPGSVLSFKLDEDKAIVGMVSNPEYAGSVFRAWRPEPIVAEFKKRLEAK